MTHVSSTPDRDATIAEVLPNYRRWLYHVATNLVHDGSNERIDDLVQEGYIAMWRSIDKHDPAVGDLGPWLRTVAHRRMSAMMAHDSKWTGMTADGPKRQSQFAKRSGDESRARIRECISTYRREHGTDPSTRKIGASLGLNPSVVSRHLQRMHMTAEATPIIPSSLDRAVESGDAALMLDAAQLFDAVELAYHYGEVGDAIDRLNEREQEYVRQRFWRDATFGELALTFPNPVKTWEDVRAKLEGDLGHLRDLVDAPAGPSFAEDLETRRARRAAVKADADRRRRQSETPEAREARLATRRAKRRGLVTV